MAGLSVSPPKYPVLAAPTESIIEDRSAFICDASTANQRWERQVYSVPAQGSAGWVTMVWLSGVNGFLDYFVIRKKGAGTFNNVELKIQLGNLNHRIYTYDFNNASTHMYGVAHGVPVSLGGNTDIGPAEPLPFVNQLYLAAYFPTAISGFDFEIHSNWYLTA
jgi:hypothetical protein